MESKEWAPNELLFLAIMFGLFPEEFQKRINSIAQEMEEKENAESFNADDEWNGWESAEYDAE